jgi:hypothetical protein
MSLYSNTAWVGPKILVLKLDEDKISLIDEFGNLMFILK